MSLTPLPRPSPEEKYIFFALPSMNGPLPAELTFRENTDIKLEIDIVEKLLFATYCTFSLTMIMLRSQTSCFVINDFLG